ncbi:hypothetical protein DERF_008042 [Dermatophagoides farinae]|uniref:Uncharacterized protein n=1 Tax=Dermatophagoides farinae TaxID=6954 RepID=A0A922L6K8_DERFA|nr:hypothetical protein DERF_008042 [Dermatophagoides farinae]
MNEVYSITIVRNAATYSASPIGGFNAPLNPIFTLKPIPGPIPISDNYYKHTLTSFNATRVANSITQPAAIRAAPAVCISFHVVSESTPIPPHGNMTNDLIAGSIL